jgi:hypothetical protein
MKELDIVSIIKDVKQLESLSNGNLHHWIYVLESANTIWERCPFKVGSFVILNRTPEITNDKSWGWLGAKHFLIKGARGVIKDREFYNGKFIFSISFDDDSWIDSYGVKHYHNDKALYLFEESWLDLFKYDQLSCEAL